MPQHAEAKTAASAGGQTPLHALHRELGAMMVDFAGWQLPLRYGSIVAEHQHTRNEAGLFDVSHMGQIGLQCAALELESLIPGDLLAMPEGTVSYNCLTDEQGGIIDDLLLYRLAPENWLMVVNAANTDTVLAHLQGRLSRPQDCQLRSSQALLALQGPAAAAVAESCAPGISELPFMHCRSCDFAGAPSLISRSGYTGEDGFEISLGATAAEAVARRILSHPAVLPIGLAARDSLRLEAGFCLYGKDIDRETTPMEAALEWTIAASRRPGGSRCGGFPGAAVILAQLQTGATRRRVGLRLDEPGMLRSGPLYSEAGQEVGQVGSGGYSPCLGAAIATAMVSTEYSPLGTHLFAKRRGRRLALHVAPLRVVSRRPA